MNTAKAVLVTLLAVLATITAVAGQREFTVNVVGEPADCVLALAGSGTYAEGSAVVVEARPSLNCRFVKWVIRGLPYSEASSNPLIFQINNDVELVAVFERMYETPGGTPIERVLVYMETNVTEIRERPPLTTMPGSEVSVSFERELYIGDKKYVFLYLEAGGEVYSVPNARIRAPQQGKLTITAYYYTYIKFLDDYYPLNQFVKPEIEAVRQISDGVRERAVGYRVGGASFKIDQPVPKQLARLVEPEYVREVRLRVFSMAEVEINGVRYTANPYAEVWVKEGGQVVITAAERLERHKLETISAGGLSVLGNKAIGFLNTPTTVTITYRELPNAFLLDIPVAGPLLLQIADFGTFLTGLEGVPALAAGILLVVSPAAAAATASFLKPTVRRMGRGAGRQSREVTAVKAAVMASLPSSRTREWEESMRVRGRLNINPEFKAILEAVTIKNTPHPENPVEEAGPVPDLRAEAMEALNSLASGEKATLSPAHLAALDYDITAHDTVVKALEEKRLKLKGGPGYLGYDAEGAVIERKLASEEAVIVVKAADIRVGEIVALEACRRAGLSAKSATPTTDKDPRKAASQLRKQAGGARVLIHLHVDEESERLVARAAPLTGITQIIVSQSPAMPAAVELSEPAREKYAAIAAAIAASRGMLQRLTHEHLDYMAGLAYSFRGVQTIEDALSRLEKAPMKDVFETLRQAFRDELSKTFTRQELELLMSHDSVEELRTSFISYVRQTGPGVRPEMEWGRFYERVKRLGIVE